jgi:hypothetical protein
VNTAIDIMLDTSFSTRGAVSEYLAASAYALAEACSRVPGIQLGLMQYDDSPHRLAPISHNRMIRLEHAQAVATGCTETEQAVGRSVAELRAVSAQRRICINVTDGARCDADVQTVVRGLGVEYYELHIVSTPGEDEGNTLFCARDAIHQGLDRLVRTLCIQGR